MPLIDILSQDDRGIEAGLAPGPGGNNGSYFEDAMVCGLGDQGVRGCQFAQLGDFRRSGG